jgi:hypothetical protein
MIGIRSTQGGPMKRFLPAIPLFLLLLFNACGNHPVDISPAQGTAVGQTQTAAAWTATISPTPVPNTSRIVEWLNAELLNADALEQTLVAKYQVLDVSFPVASNGLLAIMRVDIRCECATYGQCCNPEQMFVMMIASMKKHGDKIIEQVPGTVSEMRMVCYDHMTQFAVMAASWSDVKGYLSDQINGYQFGSRVSRSTVP